MHLHIYGSNYLEASSFGFEIHLGVLSHLLMIYEWDVWSVTSETAKIRIA